MRKQLKIAAVVSTAALLALGASMTAMAASPKKGSWKMDGNEWQCFDKDGEPYEEVFCMSNGKEYFVGEDGYLVRSQWVEPVNDSNVYYVNSAGQKVTSDWKLVTPYENEDEDEAWYYFLSSGKYVKSDDKTINDKTYYFDADGKMVTGWINYDGSEVTEDAQFKAGETRFCDETGARVENAWIEAYEPDDVDENGDEYWYYLDGNGKAVTGKKTIGKQTYFFDAEGHMIKGWITVDSNKKCEKFEGDVSTLPGAKKDLYFADEDDGHMKKNDWKKLYMPKDKEEEDPDLYWYYIDNYGKVFIPTSADLSGAKKVDFKEGTLSIADSTIAKNLSKKKMGKNEFYFYNDGRMVDDFFYANSSLYCMVDGAMATGAIKVMDNNDDNYEFFFVEEGVNRGKGFTGLEGSKVYNNGKLVTAGEYKYALAMVGSNMYLVDDDGKAASKTSKRSYKDGSEVVFSVDTAKNVVISANRTVSDNNGASYTDIDAVCGLVEANASYLNNADFGGSKALN